MKQLILTAFTAAILTGCASTEIVKSWHEPSSTIQAGANKRVLVLAMVKDETSRRVIEDGIAKDLGSNAVASYSMLSDQFLKEASDEKFSQKLKEEKFEYVLMMRLADIEKDTYYVQGTTSAGYYGGYGRYYGYGAGYYSNPGYYTTDKNYFVETTIYSIEPDKLLWTGTTKTVNPSSIEQTIKEIAHVVTEKMRKDGFLLGEKK